MGGSVDVTVTKFSDLHEALQELGLTRGWAFRGQANAAWLLVPKIGREAFLGIDDRELFSSWRRRAVAYVDCVPQNDWEWLSIAQHHGLATRLLDWTRNPLFAAYFAARECPDLDGVLLAGLTEKFLVHGQLALPGPFEVAGIATYLPSAVVPRIVRQNGVFTVHGSPADQLTLGTSGLRELRRIVIRCDYKARLLAELAGYGIHEESLFSDLDGLSRYVNWTTQNGFFGAPRRKL